MEITEWMEINDIEIWVVPEEDVKTYIEETNNKETNETTEEETVNNENEQSNWNTNNE